MNENQYYYCVVHKKSILPDELEAHRDNTCEFIIEEMKIKYRHKRKVEWQAASITQKWGMQIYTPKRSHKESINTLPKDAKIFEPERGRKLE